ncbi:DJ-1/PfpI family protein [Ciceribacter azotifigens]|uniref:DJ-1/PfpI family protein n=1 Tax=Ciceribacter azotifigens TaxID=2069303 RepID=UPI003A8B4DA9
MSRTLLLWGGVILVVLVAAGFAGWMFSLPSATAAKAPPVPQAETGAVVASLRPTGRERPVIAVIGINDATETTDYLMPAGILRRADVADVVLLATGPGPVQLYPALKVEPDATVVEFDAAHPDGADYVIVPAMSRDDDPTAMRWIRSQSEKGAKIIGVCAGAKVVAAAGLLDGKRATTHWYYLREMLRRSPTTEYVANRRVVTDGNVATTTGISASMPMTLTLIEAIAGRPKADAVARDLGLDRWDLRHASGAFKVTRPFAKTVLTNRMAFWKNEELGIQLRPGMDEVSLALVADAWSRTYRSTVATFAASAQAAVTTNGIRIVPDRVMTNWPDGRLVTTVPDQRPAVVLDRTLEAIATRYDEPTTDVVAMQLEYPRPQ